ncbi:MAG: carbon-nitrogen hydrolase family protein [Armatimonadota bacterium]
MANIRRFLALAGQIAEYKPNLVCLPECVFTGYMDQEHELRRFAEPIPGPITAEMAQLASRYRFHLCFGLLERASDGVYSSAVLLDDRGRISLVHRKIAEQAPFLSGDRVESTETIFGKLSILICGDLFHKEIIKKLEQNLKLLLVPMARCFDGQSPDRERWEREERLGYLEAVKQIGTPTAVVNLLECGENTSFGGAMVVGANGRLLAESPHGTDEILVYDMP